MKKIKKNHEVCAGKQEVRLNIASLVDSSASDF
jgi:hypothetical protein